MENSNFTGILVIIFWLGTLALSVLSAILAWKWIEPDTFLSVVGFIIVWGFLTKVGHSVMAFIVMVLGSSR
jgi:hypothetical protein